jgi:hypothetical protein
MAEKEVAWDDRRLNPVFRYSEEGYKRILAKVHI